MAKHTVASLTDLVQKLEARIQDQDETIATLGGVIDKLEKRLDQRASDHAAFVEHVRKQFDSLGAFANRTRELVFGSKK